MMRERIVPYGGLTFVVATALMLGTIIARSPDTHGNLWRSVPTSYTRTPFETVGPADLKAIQAELPPFTFPTPSGDRPAAAAAVTPETAESAPAGPTVSAASDEGEVQQVALTLTEYAISPDHLTIKLGVPVELTVTNEGKQTHGLWMADFGIYQDIRAGKTAVFRFTPSKPGRFRFTCSYSLCGKQEEHARMVGSLTVQ